MEAGGWPVQWVGTKGLWPQLKGERLKVQQSPRRTDLSSQGPAIPVPPHVQLEAGWNGNGKVGAGKGALRLMGTLNQTQAFLPPRAASLGTQSGRQLQLGAEAVTPMGNHIPRI